MNYFKVITKELTNEQLRKLYQDYQELSETGILNSNLAREIEKKIKDFYKIKENCLEVIRKEVMEEMAFRYCNEKPIVIVKLYLDGEIADIIDCVFGEKLAKQKVEKLNKTLDENSSFIYNYKMKCENEEIYN